MDQISDMIIRLKNAGMAGRSNISLPYSKLKLTILSFLKNEGFIKDFSKKGKKINKTIEVEIFLDEKKNPKIKGVRRVSKLSRRVYLKSRDIRPIKNNFGKLILSTSKGIMAGEAAKSAKLGGEALFEIW